MTYQAINAPLSDLLSPTTLDEQVAEARATRLRKEAMSAQCCDCLCYGWCCPDRNEVWRIT
jgi:hypothetical protein